MKANPHESRTEHPHAPELRVPQWIDAQGQPSAPPKLADLGDGFKVIFCFQHGCPGCHSHGIPTLQKLVKALGHPGFGFAAVQTVFEGAETNTFERLAKTLLRYGLNLPFGHDPVEGRSSTLMSDYATRGTPWFIVIDAPGEILYSGFQLDEEQLIAAWGAAIEHNDLMPFEALLAAVEKPFEGGALIDRFAQPAPREVTTNYRTFCGT